MKKFEMLHQDILRKSQIASILGFDILAKSLLDYAKELETDLSAS